MRTECLTYGPAAAAATNNQQGALTDTSFHATTGCPSISCTLSFFNLLLYRLCRGMMATSGHGNAQKKNDRRYRQFMTIESRSDVMPLTAQYCNHRQATIATWQWGNFENSYSFYVLVHCCEVRYPGLERRQIDNVETFLRSLLLYCFNLLLLFINKLYSIIFDSIKKATTLISSDECVKQRNVDTFTAIIMFCVALLDVLSTSSLLFFFIGIIF